MDPNSLRGMYSTAQEGTLLKYNCTQAAIESRSRATWTTF